MDRGVERAVGADEDVGTDDDRGYIENSQAVVDPGSVTDGDVVPVVDAQRRPDVDALPHVAENLGEQVGGDVRVVGMRLLVEAQEADRVLRERREFVICDVVVAVVHALAGGTLVVAESGVVEVRSRGDGHATRVVEALSRRGARRASRWPRRACSWEMSAAGSSGCHCTPITGASTNSMASMVPSGACALTRRPGREPCDALVVRRRDDQLGVGEEGGECALEGWCPRRRARCGG